METPHADVRSLEERAFNAWPALSTQLVDGWVLRFSAGYTKRANSVNALQPARPVSEIIDLARPLFARADLPLVVRLSPLAGPSADTVLAADGFRHLDETLVMTAPLDGSAGMDRSVLITPAPLKDWSDGFAAANAVPALHRATHDTMLASIRFPAAFATLVENGQAIAWGLAVLERGMVGLFDIVTAPAARRRGAGRRLVVSLLTWGHEMGATGAYLQVVATNHVALALYRDLGFSEAYRYHYRVSP